MEGKQEDTGKDGGNRRIQEGGAETIADNNSKTMQYIFPPGENFSSIFPQNIKKKNIQPSQ